MKSKKQPSKQRISDITKPKNSSATTEVRTAPELVIPKRSIIVPVSVDDKPAPEPIDPKHEAKTTAPPVQPAPEQQPVTSEPPQPAKEPETPPAESISTDIPEKTEDPEESNDKSKTDKTNPEVRKALEEARRQQELQEYIDNREFFVPINAVARKRSLKVSMVLVFLEFLLGLILLNLMLDAGLIELMEKIPHTNFFD